LSSSRCWSARAQFRRPADGRLHGRCRSSAHAVQRSTHCLVGSCVAGQSPRRSSGARHAAAASPAAGSAPASSTADVPAVRPAKTARCPPGTLDVPELGCYPPATSRPDASWGIEATTRPAGRSCVRVLPEGISWPMAEWKPRRPNPAFTSSHKPTTSGAIQPARDPPRWGGTVGGALSYVRPKPLKKARRATDQISPITPEPVKRSKMTAVNATHPAGAVTCAAERHVVRKARGR
jgi:hypothetical protein